MAEFLDPNALLEENDRMAQVLRLLEGFILRPIGPTRLGRPSLEVDDRETIDGPMSPNCESQASPE